MRYVTYNRKDRPCLGVIDGEDVVDIASLMANPPASMRDLISLPSAVHAEIANTIDSPECTRTPIAECNLLPPITDPGKIVCVGLNYADHAREGGHEIPTYPALFMRTATSLIGPDDPIIVPNCSEQLDYEAELAIVIGKRCRHVSKDAADEVIFGYTAFNDGSIREYQRLSAQWTAGKNFDDTGPLGPSIVTRDKLPKGASGLTIQSRLNDEVMQSSNTDQMIFDTYRIIEILTEFMTLEPGDIIATGTPSGVGHARRPQVWMRPGDRIEVEIEGIGVLSNPVVAEKS